MSAGASTGACRRGRIADGVPAAHYAPGHPGSPGRRALDVQRVQDWKPFRLIHCVLLLLKERPICLHHHGSLVCVLPLARKRVVSGKSVSVRVDLGWRRIIKKKKKETNV